MKLTFYGAAREVTGSCTLVETAKSKILVDCGMFQGSHVASSKNFSDFVFDPTALDAVVLTHAHMDHCGRLPKLIKDGFKKTIYATEATKLIAGIVMEDAVHIMEEDFERSGRPQLYDANDVQRTLIKFKDTPYHTPLRINDVTIRFFDAGHIFGSSFIEIKADSGKTVIFSGDVGNKDVPIIRETETIEHADAIVTESTYGNRIHEGKVERFKQLQEAILDCVEKKGVLLIPAFAIERTQHLLYEINQLVETKKIPCIPVYLDSPMAIKVTKVMEKLSAYYDKEALEHISHGDNFLSFPCLHLTHTRDESKTINTSPSPKIIIAGSGMMNGGRILHHLIRYVGDRSTTILIIGYQASGTLGRRLYSGEKNIRIFGKRISVRARVKAIGAFSAHADQKKLLSWIGNIKPRPKLVLCNHGEEEASVALGTRITEKFGILSKAPKFGESFEI
ncbi:MAG: MBL fold metallo-hydrolase [bacterium]|nr:MBL fold metallo-hydrolase [bacterium]